MDQIILVFQMHLHAQATLPLHVLCSLPGTFFLFPLSPHQTHFSSSACHLLQEALPAERHAYHLCFSQTLSSLDLDCWLTGPSSLDWWNPINKKFKPDPMNIFVFIYKLYTGTTIQIEYVYYIISIFRR